MEPLRIALFSDSALPVLNGVSVSVDALVRSLRDEGHSVFLYTSLYARFRDSDPNVTRFLAVRTPWTKDYPLAVPPFYPWFHDFKKGRFDIVHTHTPFTVGMVGLRWAQSLEIPVVATYHTHYDKYAHYVPFFPKRYLRYKIAKHTNFYYGSVDQVVTPSEASKRWLKRHSVKRPITVVPTGVPEPKALDRRAVRAGFEVHPMRKVVLYVGRLALEKNLSTLLEAAPLMIERDKEVEIWIVGDGPARDEYLNQARALGIGDRVRFWGFKPRSELDAYYAAADVFAFPSMTETQGLVVLEAMSHGLPAVVVQGGGASGAVESGQNGFVVANDPHDVAEAVVKLLSDPLLHSAVSERARATGLSSTVGAMTRRVLDVYQAALSGPPSVVEALR
ncbi:MAG: glycosyltransferase [Armatimonadetes bacterium]|nr:glycosyltransferase [Armatimonadota bacterium]